MGKAPAANMEVVEQKEPTPASENKHLGRIIGQGMVQLKQDCGQGRRKTHYFDAYDVMSIETGANANCGIVRLARGSNATAITFIDETAEDVAARVMAHKIQFAASESIDQLKENSLSRIIELVCASVLTNLDETIEARIADISGTSKKQVEAMVKTVLTKLSRESKSGD